MPLYKIAYRNQDGILRTERQILSSDSLALALALSTEGSDEYLEYVLNVEFQTYVFKSKED